MVSAWMAPFTLYSACVIGALALYLLVRPGPRGAKVLGTVLGLGALAWLALESVKSSVDTADRPGVFFVIFSLIAIASAVRMITHHRPIYSALYFVMVVLSSAGLFLLLEAEFMAFALVIVYAGAILITYVFVLMLSQQAPLGNKVEDYPQYDRVPREPAAAAMVGFVMLALLTDMAFNSASQIPVADSVKVKKALRQAWTELEQMPKRFEERVLDVEPEFIFPAQKDLRTGDTIRIDEKGAYVLGAIGEAGDVPQRVDLPDSAMPENVQHVGWALVYKFPASLEVAGIILLLAMFGAVVLAQRQIEISEEEKRLAAQAAQSKSANTPSDSAGGAA